MTMTDSTSKAWDSLQKLGASQGDKEVVDPGMQSQLDEIKLAELKKNLIKWAKEKYVEMKGSSATVRAQMELNLSFFNGDQYVELRGSKLVQVPPTKKRLRLVINRIKPVIRTELARLTSQDPTAEVVPATSEDADIIAARAAEQVYLSTKTRKNLKKTMTDAAFWSTTCGLGYVKTSWNKDVVVAMPNDLEAKGDINYMAVSPFHVYVPDLTVTDIEDQPYLINVMAKPVDWVQARWADILPEGMKPTVMGMSEIFDSSRMNTAGGTQDKPDSHLIMEVWVKPGGNKYLPNGGMFTMVDDNIVVLSEKMPYDHGEYPFAKLESVPSGTYYTTSVIEDLIQPQKQLNRNRSQIIETGNLLGSPGYTYHRGAIDPNKMTNQLGQMIEVTPGMEAPMPLTLPPMPAHLAQMTEEFLRDIEDLSGQHQVSKGNTPSGVTAATAIQFLQEADNSYMSTSFDSMEMVHQKIAKHTIALFIQLVDSERLIKVIGKDGQASEQLLRGSDIKTGTDIRVEAGSGLPESKAARIAMIMDMMSRGALDPQMGFELMDLPHMKDYWEITKRDQRQAQRENIQLSRVDPAKLAEERQMREQMKAQALAEMGMTIDDVEMEPQAAMLAAQYDMSVLTVNDWDNHEAHIEEHNNFRKGQEFEGLPPEIQEEFARHIAQHEQMMQEAMFNQIMKDQMQGVDPEQMAEDPSVDPNAEAAPGENMQQMGDTAPVDAQPAV